MIAHDIKWERKHRDKLKMQKQKKKKNEEKHNDNNNKIAAAATATMKCVQFYSVKKHCAEKEI